MIKYKLWHKLTYRMFSRIHFKLQGIRMGQALNMEDRIELDRYRRKYPNG